MRWFCILLVLSVMTSGIAQGQGVSESIATLIIPNYCATCPIESLQQEFEQRQSGCSIYCELDTVDVFGSSTQSCATRSECDYHSVYAHDFDLRTAWAEGATGNGVGEYFEAVFYTESYGPNSPLVLTELEFYNGQWASPEDWAKHGRIKTLTMWVNDEPHCRIQLLDERQPQAALIPPIRIAGASILLIRFEIQEVYPGAPGQPTCLTEMVFGGTGHATGHSGVSNTPNE